MRLFLFIAMLLTISGLNAQTSNGEVIRGFYKALNEGDSASVRSFFHEDAFIKHIEDDTAYQFNLDGFLMICSKFESDQFKEEILHINYEPNDGSFGKVEFVEVYFKFYLNGEFHHCGMDQFVMSVDGYTPNYIDAIYSIPCDCYEEPENEELDRTYLTELLNDKMDDWHSDVAEYDFDAYFGFMDKSFIFLGTDPGERWTKEEFFDFSKPYFDKESTWNFTPLWRNWYFSDDGNTAWFEEQLDTWMDECRGSGVLKKIDGQWKIVHYNLTVLVENEKMKKFIKLRKK